MSKRAAKFVSAIFASVLAGSPFATVSHGAPEAAAADSCLSKPKGAPPQGGHWYYRIDHATKRHCWYLGEEKEKLSRAAPEASPSPSISVSTPQDAGTARSIADARAELPMPQTRIEQDTSVFAGPRATVADAAPPENNQRVAPIDVDVRRSVVSSRWPELAGVVSSVSPAPSTGNAGPSLQQTAEAAPPPPAATVMLAAADASAAKPSGSIQQLLIAIVGALSLAGLIASAIFRFGGRRQTGRRNARVERRVNWDMPKAEWDAPRAERRSLLDEARAAQSMREIARPTEGDLPRRQRAAGEPDERIAQMLARQARSAAT